ncbi:hypothetical protein TrRE_jg7253, partial [Triparma retinervis]
PLSQPFHTLRIKPNTLRVDPGGSRPRVEPKSVARATFSTSGYEGDVWVAVLTVEAPGEGESDNHIWPKGTDLWIDGGYQTVRQRKQQSHDRSKWLGMSYMLKVPPSSRPGARTVVLTTSDDASYVCCVIGGLRRSDDSVVKEVEEGMETWATTRCVDDAKRWAQGRRVCLDGSVGGDMAGLVARHSLTDASSMKAIGTPVVGRGCRHTQAFDLGYFVGMNGFPSARRWACPVCGRKTPVGTLVRSGLFERALRQGGGEGKEGIKGKCLVVDCDGGGWEVLRPPSPARATTEYC